MIMDAVVTVTSNRSLASKTFHAGDGLHVMVVDDDIICLSIVAGILKSWKYEGIDGLCLLFYDILYVKSCLTYM